MSMLFFLFRELQINSLPLKPPVKDYVKDNKEKVNRKKNES